MKRKWSIMVVCLGLATVAPYAAAEDGGVAAIGPRLITYQGLVENALGPIDDQSMVVEFRAFPALEGGTQRGLIVSQTLSPSAVRKGVFSVEMDADELALPDNADDTYLEIALCSPAPCSPVALAPRQHLTAAPLAVSARSLGGAARAETDGSLVVESTTAASGEMLLNSSGATEAMWLSAADGVLSAARSTGTSSLRMQALSANGDSTAALLDDSAGTMILSKVSTIADNATAAISTDTLQFNMTTGEVAAVRDTGPAPLRLSSKSPGGDQTLLLLDDATGQATLSREIAAAETAGISPPPKLVLNPRMGSIAASVDAGTATLTLLSSSASGDKTQLLLDDASSTATFSKEFAAANTAGLTPSPKLRISLVPAEANTAGTETGVTIEAFEGVNAATIRIKSGNDEVLSYDPAVGEAVFSAPVQCGGSIKIDGTVGAEKITSAGNLETRLGVTGMSAGHRIVQLQDDQTEGSGSWVSPNIVLGWESNVITAGATGVAIGGGGGTDGGNVWEHRVTDTFGTIGGGADNQVGNANGNPTDARWATIGGGVSNRARAEYSIIGGGSENQTNASVASVCGGEQNIVSALGGAILGGGHNTAQGNYAVAAGGWFNDSSGNRSSLVGGESNTASGPYSVVTGGFANSAGGSYSTIAGGRSNSPNAQYATIGGGFDNDANGIGAIVAGGQLNMADGLNSSVPGGLSNRAGGDYSVAGGRRAVVRNAAAAGDSNGDEGSFMWADSTDADFTSNGPDQFLVRAKGGTTIYSDAAATTGVTLAAGGGSWASVSDRNLKQNVEQIDTRDVLERLIAIPITTWNYNTQDPAIRHVGPMAQDFHAAFGVGEEETRITSIDSDGVALAAIQGLYEIVQEKNCEIEGLKAKAASVEQLEAKLATLEALVAKLAAEQNGGSR